MIYEVKLFMTYFGNRCLNRWNYVSSGVPASVSGSFGLAFALGFAPVNTVATLFGALKSSLNVNVVFTGYEISALYDPIDFYTGPFLSQSGSASSEGTSPTAAYGFRTNRVNLEIKRATKRFVGVDETRNTNGGNLEATFLNTNMALIAQRMSENLLYTDEGNSLTYAPAVLSRQKYTTESGKTAYRVYPTELEQLEHTAIGVLWEPYSQVRTQVSRQYGRGV